VRWGWREKQRVRELLEAAGWRRDDFMRRRGFPKLRRGMFTVQLDEARCLTIERITQDGTTLRYTAHVADIGPFEGRGWAERTAARVAELVPDPTPFVEAVSP
jgi:hypothetical protein